MPFTYPFCYTPHPLAIAAANRVRDYLASQPRWADEISAGKMFGVLIYRRPDGTTDFAAAYSGLLGGRCDWQYFVPPVYDSQQPDGHFRQGEAELDNLTLEIRALDTSPQRCTLAADIARATAERDAELAAWRTHCAAAKAQRDLDRRAETESGTTNPEAEAQRIRQSQYDKAETRRIRARHEAVLTPLRTRLADIDRRIADLRATRRRKSEALQHWLFEQYVVHNARGEARNLIEVFATTPQGTPPSGAGDCCAPKLLEYAYRNGLTPLHMAEFWVGASPVGEVRHDGQFYPACRGKCLPILTFMLQGLDVDPNPLATDTGQDIRIIYEDRHLAVIDKPSGLLAVRGREARDSVEDTVRRLWHEAEGPMIVHRLDMDTSGLMLIAKDKATHAALAAQFAARSIRKRYIALLDGVVRGDKGQITLPLRPDPLDRPRQVIDHIGGKAAVTDYEILRISDGRTLIALYPHTGRTHQLRLHCAHSEGLGTPIVGDALYGKIGGALHTNISDNPRQRLCLHAERITFCHPATGEELTFSTPADFV